ncbi:MAG: glutathione peroxidase [Burkholderiaceae bacterium]
MTATYFARVFDGWLLASMLVVSPVAVAQSVGAQDCPALLAHTFPKLQDESPQNLCQYKGKVLLVVNTASYCGFTPQYEGLEKLHAQYGSKGLVVLGFPSGDFGDQEKANNKEIAEFCFNTYGVKFPMFAKTSVRGDKANPLFAALAKSTGQAPKWNFHKYLIDRQGRVLKAYPSQVEPMDGRLTKEIEAALGAN